MRISDWSSDVCSSDLGHRCRRSPCRWSLDCSQAFLGSVRRRGYHVGHSSECHLHLQHQPGPLALLEAADAVRLVARRVRSEERRVGKEGVCTCRSRWLPYLYKKNKLNKTKNNK